VSRYLVGTIKGWELYFKSGLNEYVEPAWAAVRPCSEGSELHGSAFLIPDEEAEQLDRQEGGYNVLPVTFTSYCGEIVENVGLYVPKTPFVKGESKEAVPSYRYLKLLRDGAREGNLSQHWLEHLDSVEYYVTPPDVREQTLKWISEFEADETRKDETWDETRLAQHDGSDPSFPPHTSIMGFVIRINPDTWVFSSWKGHNITRRNLLQYNGKSLDSGDIRHDQPGYRPLPKLSECSDEEKEYLMQSLEGQLHRGSRIVARYGPFLEDQAR